ncbi:Mitochondrial chaperone bcs1 [Aspergillus sp. HF37]|nr:Mitochondrial chaperone bcs1 [Aspergillus sp. HF37]
MANTTTPLIPTSDTAVLEAFIPGYSLISRFFVTYLHIDPSIYVPYILVGGVLAAALRVIVRQARALLEEHFVSTVEIRATDEIYQYLTYWLARQDFVGQARHVVVGTRAASRDDDEDEDSDIMADSGFGPGADEDGHADTDFDDYWAKTLRRDKYKPLRYTPAQGTHYFRFRGRYVAFTREVSEHGGGGASSYTYFPERAERLYISTLGRGTGALRELLGEAQRGYVEKDTARMVIYRGTRYGVYHDWVRCMARTPRPLSTVVLDEGQKGTFVADVKEYLHPRTRRWYSNRGIPYRRGYLLHGPAGTGKTSLCAAAAGLFGLRLYLLSLGSGGLNEDGLVELFLDLPSRCIVLLEDVDSAGMTMKRGDGSSGTGAGAGETTTDEKTESNDADDAKPKGIGLSAILNVIDGVAATEGRILVMTTNHPEKLDPALLRPGRVDMSIEFGYADKPVVQELFSSIYSCLEGEGPRSSGADGAVDKKVNPEASGRDNESVLALAREFASRVPAGELTAAEIQGYLLNHKGKPEEALEGANEWVKGVQEKRASG